MNNTNIITVEAEVTGFEMQNEKIKDKLKTVFYCKSKNKQDRTCIAWGNTHIKQGNIIHMKGRFNDDVFLVWDMHIIKNSTNT